MHYVKMFLCVVSIAVLSGLSFGQEWEVVSHKPGSYPNDIMFVDENVAISAGSHHPIMRSVDRGHIWEPIDVPVFSALYRVFFLNEQLGWAVGDNGTILKTEDSGLTWALQNSGVETRLRSVFFLDESMGWVVGYLGICLKTTNGGENWEPVEIEIDLENKDLLDVEFLNSQIGWIVGGDYNSILAATENGGETWSVTIGGGESWIKDIHIFDETARIISGKQSYRYGYVERIEADTSYVTTFYDAQVHDLYFLNDTLGYIVGYSTYEGGTGIFANTFDGGITWEVVFEDIYHPYAVAFCDANNGILRNKWRTWTTYDGGQNWTNRSPPVTEFVSANFASQFVGGTITSENDFIVTIDGGENWTRRSLPVESLYSTRNLVRFSSESEVWIICRESSTADISVLLHSSDTGATWNEVDPGFSNSYYGLDVYDNHVWVSGSDQTILHSPDNGVTWEEQTTGMYVACIEFLTEEVGFASNTPQGTAIIKTTDGGVSWDTIAAFSYPEQIRDFQMINESVGYLVIHDQLECTALVYKTTDGGVNWTSCFSESLPGTSEKIVFQDLLTGWVYNNSRAGCCFWKTTDGGSNWTLEDFPTATTLYDMTVAWPYIWAVGMDSTILRYSLISGSEEIEPLVPDKFTLNTYPNPFNSTATLAFELPQAGRVSLQVFDITGRLVETLENRVIPAGAYSVQFEGDHLASGIYFVNLKGNIVSTTKKIVLLK